MDVTLNWQAPPLQPGQSAIKSYRVYARVINSPDFGLINEVTETTFIDEAVDPGDWQYKVTTVDAKNRESSGSNVVNVNVPGSGVPPDSVPPSPPLNLTATVS